MDLDGAAAHGGEVLQPGQHLTWQRPPWDEPDVPLHFDVLYEDSAVLAVSKPSGLPTMPAGGFLEHTLLALVHAGYPEAHPLHRLGRFTSGLVLFARTPAAAAALGTAWRSHEVIKDYRALVSGQPPWDTLEITIGIGPVPHPRLGTVFAARDDGKPARSTVTVIARRDTATLCDVRIATGRPHQIRIHLAWAGHPLVGDPLYGVGGQPLVDAPGLPGDGGYLLHAHRVRCAHPDGRRAGTGGPASGRSPRPSRSGSASAARALAPSPVRTPAPSEREPAMNPHEMSSSPSLAETLAQPITASRHSNGNA